MSSANLRFQKRAVPDFTLFKHSPATGLAASITIIRNFLVHFILLERSPLSGLSAPITIIIYTLVHCLLYCGVSNNSDGCGTTGNVGLNFSLLMGLRLGPGTYELREFALPKTGRARFHLF